MFVYVEMLVSLRGNTSQLCMKYGKKKRSGNIEKVGITKRRKSEFLNGFKIKIRENGEEIFAG